MNTEEQTNTAVAVVEQPKNVEVISDGFILPDPEVVAQRAAQAKKMMQAACQVLSTGDIVNFGGNPYIDHMGCKKIANLFGLVIRLNTDEIGFPAFKKEYEDKNANKYTIYVSGKVWHKSSPINAESYVGSCSSFSEFFSQWQEKDENKKVISAKFLDESKVQEKAVANFIQRAIKKMLGLSFTWEELEEYGIKKEKCRGFSYNKQSSAADDDEATKKMRTEIWDMLMELCHNDKALAGATIQKHTAFDNFKGYTDINKVSVKMIKKLYDKTVKAYDEYLKNLGSEVENASNE